jgi:Ca2+-binding RTX toxin-like protein
MGGTEVDILDGGTGNDILKGGAGADLYKLSGTYGTDTITDSDGVGIITVDNVALTGGTQVTDHIYRNESQKYTYTLAGSGDTQSLFTMATIKDNDGQGSITLDSHAIFGASKQILQDIYHDEGPGKKTYIKLSDGGLLVAGAGGEQNIYIQQWNSNNLGISLSGEVAAAPEATPFSTLVGDEKTIISHFKTSKHLPCSPISMRVAEHPLFNLNTQKPAANDNNWRLVA